MHGLFPKVVLSLVYEKLSEVERNAYLIPLLYDIHGIASIGSIVNWLTQSQSLKQVETGEEVLLKMLEAGRLSSIWNRESWGDLFPEKEWEDCCENAVQWIISIPELVTRFQHKPHESLQSTCFFSFHLHNLLESVVEKQKKKEENLELYFLGLMMKRLINRGLGTTMVNVLVQNNHTFTNRDGVKSLLFLTKSIRDPHATEKFCLTLLLQLAEKENGFEIFKTFILNDDQIDDELGYILFTRLLMQNELSLTVCVWLVDVLSSHSSSLSSIVTQLSKIWSNRQSIESLALPRQGYITALLKMSIPCLKKIEQCIENSEWYQILLEGVGNRLASCLDTIRFQGMRIAQTLAMLDPNSEPLFGDLEVDFESLQPDEQWEAQKNQLNEERPLSPSSRDSSSVDSDDDSDFCSSIEDANLEPMDLSEGNGKAFKRGPRPLTLVDLIQDLKSASDDPMKTISALKTVVPLLKKNPHELKSLGAEIAKLLIHVPIPDWIHQELKKEDAFDLKNMKSISEVRVCCLRSLLESVPLQSGEALGQLFSSSQLTVPQRLELLESMRQASITLSSPPSEQKSEMLSCGERRVGTSKVWGVRSLEAAKKRGHTNWRNKFTEVVGLWMTSLLASSQKVTYGFDLMERDHRVLGSLLLTLGTFAESVSQSITSTALSLVAFPLLKIVYEKKSEICFLRRCVFQSLISLLNGLPIARLSMVIGSPLEPVDETDKELAEMIIWIRSKSEAAKESDNDYTCRILASTCAFTCHKISQKALELVSTNETKIKLTVETPFEIRLPSLKWSRD
eukprot:g535.t1